MHLTHRRRGATLAAGFPRFAACERLPALTIERHRHAAGEQTVVPLFNEDADKC